MILENTDVVILRCSFGVGMSCGSGGSGIAISGVCKEYD